MAKTLQEIYNHPSMRFTFREVSVASFGVNSEAKPIKEAHNSDDRFYDWYVIGRRIPKQYKPNLKAINKLFMGYLNN